MNHIIVSPRRTLVRHRLDRGRMGVMMSTVAATSLIILLVCVSGAASQTPSLPSAVDRFIRAELSRQQIPGMSVAVLRGDSVLLARGYGLANLEHRVAATDSTVYAVGSVSKQFT